MNYTKLIAKNLKEIHFGKTWTWGDLKTALSDVSYQEAIYKIENFNTIAALTYHINYYIAGAINVLEGKPLTIKDKLSFNVPVISSEEEWQQLQDKMFTDATKIVALIEKLPDEILVETFDDEKWGNYFRNLHGLIEHSHYHLGQIVLLKKIIKSNFL